MQPWFANEIPYFPKYWHRSTWTNSIYPHQTLQDVIKSGLHCVAIYCQQLSTTILNFFFLSVFRSRSTYCIMHTGYRNTMNVTGYNKRSWKWWRHRNVFGKKILILAIFLIFLDGYFVLLQKSSITFYRYNCREICSWQTKIKTFFSFCQACFHQPQHTSVNIFWLLHIFCANAFVIYILLCL